MSAPPPGSVPKADIRAWLKRPGIDIEDFGASASISRTFDVSNKADWDAAAAAIQTGGNNKNYIINLSADVSLPGRGTASLFGSVTGITVSLRGEKTLSLDSGGAKGYLLTLGNNQSFILRESGLVGRNDNDTSLVFVQGRFTMRSGEISGNTVNSSASVFTMTNGEIYKNTAGGYGGGVFVSVSGSFAMSRGVISGNRAFFGGGVYVYNGAFAKTGGTVYGDTDNVFGNGNDTDNTAIDASNPGANGHAVFYEYYHYYYRNETLADNASGNINTTDALPITSGETLNNWTMR